jgi:hypothetical protein
VGAHRAQLGDMALIARESCKKTFARTAISLSTSIGSPWEEVRRTAEIQSLLVTLLTPPYDRRSRNCASAASTLSAPPQKQQTSKPKIVRAAHSSTHPYERLVEVSYFGIWVSGLGLQRQASLSRTPACGPVHSDACLHAPAPPPAGCFQCQQVSHVSLREEGVGESAHRDTDRECRQNRVYFKKIIKTANLKT